MSTVVLCQLIYYVDLYGLSFYVCAQYTNSFILINAYNTIEIQIVNLSEKNDFKVLPLGPVLKNRFHTYAVIYNYI